MKKITLLILATLTVFAVQARNNKTTDGERAKGASTPSVMAGCQTPTVATDLDINNIKLLVQTGGDFWWDLQNPKFEVPKGSGRHSIFAGSLWMGGQDVSGQLKVAAIGYRSGGNTDFWPGPLSTTDAEVDPTTCVKYDRHFVTYRTEIDLFRKWYDAGVFDGENGTNTQSDDFPDYTPPAIVDQWPAHGDPEKNEAEFLAPFVDRNGDGQYDPLLGDYPGYDFDPESSCGGRRTNVYGDQNLWWVFNDKGNVHTATGGNSIGMEIRAQAFSFATNDEVNNMTFMNFELVNRSSFTLTETYFGVFADTDLGGANDDFVGCDVEKGLGFCYNGDNNDEDNQGAKGYGVNPPAIGFDFFEGPFQDSDDKDNAFGIGENEALNGIGYGDGEVDNERYGMRKFVYFSRTGASCCTDPSTGTEYYNYLRGIWKDGVPMTYGGTGHETSGNGLPADFMFPGKSDPKEWGTKGINPGDPNAEGWTEVTAGNSPGDRRFIQSAGPFTLTPGAVNDITVGVVWARAASGGPLASLDAMIKADKKTQALFDNCFRLLGGPNAPELAVQELDQELILYIKGTDIIESYVEKNPFIIPPDCTMTIKETTIGGNVNIDTTWYVLSQQERDDYQSYKFQGYKIYQLRDGAVDPSALNQIEQARLVYQGDIRDGVSQLLNYEFNLELNATVPDLMVDGSDKGIVHSLKITEDLFATGDRRLINHKTYYFMAIAYAYNNFKQFDPTNPAADGQTTQFLASRKAAGGAIKSYSGIPHNPLPEQNGTIINSKYGDGVEVTRVEGQGNGGSNIQLKQESLADLFKAPWKIKEPVYEAGRAPINVKIVDPLNVIAEDFTVQFVDSIVDFVTKDVTVFNNEDTKDLSDAYWKIFVTSAGGETADVIYSDRTIKVEYEQLVLQYGISVMLEQSEAPGTTAKDAMLEANIIYADASKNWLVGIPDLDGDTTGLDWILAGPAANDNDKWQKYNGQVGYVPEVLIDPNSNYEKVLGGTWAPFKLASDGKFGPIPVISSNNSTTLNENSHKNTGLSLGTLENLNSVDIVFTDDKTKWTRCPVVEAYFDKTNTVGGATKGFLREAASVDKDGNPSGWPGSTTASSNVDDANYISAKGMGWFPGYAVDLETGERLNMAFSENSWLAGQNGNDMLWNPTDVINEGSFGDFRYGGMHYVYVFRNNADKDGSLYQTSSNGTLASWVIPVYNPFDDAYNEPENRMPAYDAGAFAAKWLETDVREPRNTKISLSLKNVYSACTWVGYPLLNAGHELLETDATVKLRVRKGYQKYAPGTPLDISASLSIGTQYYVNAGPIEHNGDTLEQGDAFIAQSSSMSAVYNSDFDFVKESSGVVTEVVNGGLPLYTFTTKGLEAIIGLDSIRSSVLDLINIVPNPYYAYSQYETDRLDNRVKITNLPDKATITIYTVNGSLVRRYSKDDPTITSIDWDLKNFANVPVGSGVYLVHVSVPDVGERVLKWFGALRPADLDSF